MLWARDVWHLHECTGCYWSEWLGCMIPECTALRIAPSLTKLFNVLLNSSQWPNCLKFLMVLTTIVPLQIVSKVLEQHVCSLLIEYHQAIYQQVITNWKDQGMRLYSTCGQNKFKYFLHLTNRPPACSTSILPNILRRSHPISMAWLFQNRMYYFRHVTIIFHWVFKSMTMTFESSCWFCLQWAIKPELTFILVVWV